MTKNPVAWFEIYVTDMARARKFYEAVLGVQLEILVILVIPKLRCWDSRLTWKITALLARW